MLGDAVRVDPDEIADIQILKGPSAAAIYGTQGSNGVILITTKRGVAGRTRYNVWIEQGINQDKNKYRNNFYGSATSLPSGARCRLVEELASPCHVCRLR